MPVSAKMSVTAKSEACFQIDDRRLHYSDDAIRLLMDYDLGEFLQNNSRTALYMKLLKTEPN
jgi:hypothetical protein